LALDVGRSRQRAQRRDHLAADRLDLGAGGITQLDIDPDGACIDPDVLGRLAGDQVLAGVGVHDHAAESAERTSASERAMRETPGMASGRSRPMH
jgi:hypothetical protein